MTVVSCWAPGAGKGTQAPAARRATGRAACGVGRPASARPCAAGTPLGREADRLHEPRRAGARRHDRAGLPRPARSSPMRARARSSTASRARRSRRRRSTTRWPRPGRRVDRALYIDVPPRSSSGAWPGRGSARANGHVYNLPSQPAQGRRASATSTARPRPARRRRPETVRARLAQQLPPMFEVVDHYASSGVLTTVDGDGGHGRGHRRCSLAALDRPGDGAPDRGHPQVSGARSSGWPARAGSSPRSWTSSGRAPAGRHDRRARSTSPRRTSARAARSRHSSAYPGLIRAPFPATRVHLDRRRGRPRRPRQARIREGQIVSVDAGAIVDGWHGDAARTFIVGEAAAGSAPAGRHDPRGA